ncbi:uncharacterized protein [Manis javanica]|uniref:uncharacterized protein n=1 Tax=Manis javanica TaxID=9974 RepID=UPI003C6D5AE0
MLGALRWGRGERRAPRCPLVPRGRRSRSHCQLHSPAGSSPPGRGSCRDSRGVSACTGASASLGALLRPASGSGELPAVAEPLRGPGGAPDTPPGRTGPASTPASPVAGPAPSALAPPPPPLPRGAAGGRLPASQRHLPKRSRPAPPGGLQLSGSRRGSRGRAASLPPPPPQARSTRAGAAAARPPPRQGRRASLRFLIYAPEEASQCLNILQPSLILLADTREASKENKRRGCFSGIWLFCSAGKQGVPGRTEDHRTQDNIQTTSTPARTQRLAKGPPALLPGHSITTEDFDRQKQAQSQWLKRDFEDKTETASNSDSANPPATPPASTLALPAAGTATSSASPQAPMTNPLFLPKYIIFLKKLNPLGLPSFPGTSTPTFGQNTPDPGVGASGSSLSSGVSSAPAQGFAGPGTFGCGPFPSGKRRG